jgi:sugar phosphate isomerase/epimerase
MRTGVNSVLWGGHSLDDAFAGAARAGYDGIELAAIPGMAPEHLDLAAWTAQVGPIKELSERYGLPLLAMEQPSQDPEIMAQAFAAAEALGIPVVNCGPGGKSGDEESLAASIKSLGELARQAEGRGVVLCVKAHVGAAIYNTPTSLRALEEVTSPAFGLDMDPSHIHRAGENAPDALKAVVSRVRHVHIRDCKGRQQSPGAPEDQACGRGDIDLLAYVAVLHDAGYDGAVELEVIGAKAYDLVACQAIASESRGHLQACLQASGER